MAIEITDFREFKKNTLKGFMTARLTTVGLEIHDIAVHERDGQRWIQLPAKPFEKPDGGKGWNYIVSFYEKTKYHQFQYGVLDNLSQAFLCLYHSK